ncbi:ubiquitin carboxyl-terminal hydrolase [Apiospora marii]|uniref:Ubiquitin carboxyl-terminal hydrolase n=1 Tax=Apiospora marii TaxID=335849 RepID=A0ABR1S6S0_9PEZI
MDLDSRASADSTDRAVSSEPCSTRPNPFGDSDISARKRRRTSRTGSRSRSVESSLSRVGMPDESAIMRVDTPEPIAPSTPPSQSRGVISEPHSSKVTINLRNTEGHVPVPSSPESPSTARIRKDCVKPSVEASEMDMGPAPQGATSNLGDIDEEDSDDSEVQIVAVSNARKSSRDEMSFTNLPTSIFPAEPHDALDMDLLMFSFPYHSADESCYDTVARLVQFLQQRRSSQCQYTGVQKLIDPENVQFEEVLGSLKGWFDQYLIAARSAPTAVVQSFGENKAFWANLPELFYIFFGRRHALPKPRDLRELTRSVFLQLAQITAFFLIHDCRALEAASHDDEASEPDMMSASYLPCLAIVGRHEEQNGQFMENTPEISAMLELFHRCSGGAMSKLNEVASLHLNLLPRFPRRTMDNLLNIANLADTILQDISYPAEYRQISPEARYTRAQSDLVLGHRLFNTVSDAVRIVIDKCLNHFAHDTANGLIPHLTTILRLSLHGEHKEAMELVREHQKEHPEIALNFAIDTISHEWRYGVLVKLIRSRQMQLRVAAVTMLSQDLVSSWRKTSDAHDEGGQGLEYLRYFAKYLVNTGLIDYILGPTCHPEITQESSNIIGFLVVTITFTAAQANLFWDTVTSTQDPRVAEALVRMLARITTLMVPEQQSMMWQHMQNLPLEAMTPYMRDLCDAMIKAPTNKQQPSPSLAPMTTLHFNFILRLMRESSVLDSQGSIAFPEVQHFAMMKFKELLHHFMPPNVRQALISDCITDIASKSPTTSGSLSALSMLIHKAQAQNLAMLIAEHDFARLIIDELEATISRARDIGNVMVYANTLEGNSINNARRDLICSLILNHGSSITSVDGRRLWDLLVGTGAVCHEDRRAAWHSLNALRKHPHQEQNQYLISCLHEYLPTLPPSCYCEGALEFVRYSLLSLVNDPNGAVFDEEGQLETDIVELIWHIILTAPSQSIEKDAIQTLVNEVYVEGSLIMSFPLHRARKAHFGLVNRCLDQLAAAARALQAFNNSPSNRDDGSMITEDAENQQKEQELKFVRSLLVLRTFQKTLQSKAHFAAPDLRSLMLQAPGTMEGESAGLKYQSFDGHVHTEVKPLSIGRQNTAASLLASLREETGFDNYRIFYRGAPLAPTEEQICKSLDELGVHDGLILVKKETGAVLSPVRIKPGASPLEIEIMSHFKQLWEYLSMEEELAQEIYAFLVKLPADESFLQAFEDGTATSEDIFPLGQPFKCLYAIHALREYLSTRRLKAQVSQVSEPDTDAHKRVVLDQSEALIKAASLVVTAICNKEVIGQCANEAIRIMLSLHLVDNLVQLLKESGTAPSVVDYLTPALLERLLEILRFATAVSSTQNSIELINRSLEALLECCIKSNSFWDTFKSSRTAKEALQNLLVDDDRPYVRKGVVKLMSAKIFYNHSPPGTPALAFAEFFWPIAFELLPRAVGDSEKSEEVFSLAIVLIKKLGDAESAVLDLGHCLFQCGDLLLQHNSVEDISHPERIDVISHGLLSILSHGGRHLRARNVPLQLPQNFLKVAFRKHLFPEENEEGPLVPEVLLNPSSRNMLCDILSNLARETPGQLRALLRSLEGLTKYCPDQPDDPYRYELPPLFDRAKAIRSSSGYPGLRNLSNTCYLNSLFTQLFMNTGFRRFMLERPIMDTETHHLLSETQVLFANMQGSIRRFVDPQSCVSSIMTYEETPIDIHNQMDVDEFYNLLFDRWEAQLPTERAKKTLKSIYGGQLVQQVKSKECEHVSERMEPFSAIQCDIKGKSGLEASLQAYVDGEIMEGDNKYKCETCDRHVDAVKRACLKDIPDNLIFHLKRFDFNLRTLQRSKINDYFPFPSKIDMQPYTIEHLSNPSDNAEPDTFELVGVLVHSGTAESGHYYSYIRERPSTNASPWVEFNDDSVTTWDPSSMAGMCFGGQDYPRSHYDNGHVYEKVYSAYMLFYQRSSSLRRQQAELLASGIPGPLKFALPSDLDLAIKEENWAIIHRHCTNDPTHIPFVVKVLANAWEGECAEDHMIQDSAIKVALGHLDQVVSRAKETPDFDALYHVLVSVCRKCPRCCAMVFKYFEARPEALRNLIQRNADPAIRHQVGSLFIFVLSTIRTRYPLEYGVSEADGTAPGRTKLAGPPLVMSAGGLFLRLWETFHSAIRAWPEFFGVMEDFAQLGRPEAAVLLQADFLEKLILIIAADANAGLEDVPMQYSRLVTVVNRRMATKPPNYENVIALIDTLMGVMDSPITRASTIPENSGERLAMSLREQNIPYTAREINRLHASWPGLPAAVFIDKLIQIDQNAVATDSIIGRLMELNESMDDKVLDTLRYRITGQMVSHAVAPYLRMAVLYVQTSNNPAGVETLISHVNSQAMALHNVAEGLNFLDFFKETFDSSRVSQKSLDDVELQGLRNLPCWAPGLIGSVDRAVAYSTEVFLHDVVFSHGSSPNFGDEDGGAIRSQAVARAGAEIAIECLVYLRDTYVARGVQAPRDPVGRLEAVITAAEGYFNGNLGVDDLKEQYQELRQEPVRRLTVDEIEEDGSDWDNSIASSEQMDSLADLSMQAMGELQDAEMQ